MEQKPDIAKGRIAYKWIALSNTTLGIFMAMLDGSIVEISLPAIFHGIGLNPLAPGETDYLLWTLMGYLVITATLLVTFGRISDMFGRVKFYNLGFAIFAVGSIMLYLVHGTGNGAAMQIIIFRLIQAVGGAFLIANSTAIITDAFPTESTRAGNGHQHDCWYKRNVSRTLGWRNLGGDQLALCIPRQCSVFRGRDHLGLSRPS